MKKTLAAVLAAAMALSTASVAMAKDYPDQALVLGDSSGSDGETPISYDSERKINVSVAPFSEGLLGWLYDNNAVDIKAIVTEGSNKLTAAPSFSVKEVSGSTSTGTFTQEYTYTWNTTTFNYGDVVLTNGQEITDDTLIPVDANGDCTTSVNDIVGAKKWSVFKKSSAGQAWLATPTGSACITKTRSGLIEDERDYSGNVAQMKFKVAHTYGTGDTTVKFKVRVTIKKNVYVRNDTKALTLDSKTNDINNEVKYKKGDTYTSEEAFFKAKYQPLNDFAKDMQLSLQEVKDGYVIFNGETLYDEIGNETFTINFEDTAIFEAKLSASQKKLNLYYTLDEVTSVTDAYPNVDFEFITFKGASSVTSFVNSGTMTFNAIGGKNTQVYKLETAGGGDDGDTLVPLDGTYDSTYNTITVKNIKRLGGTFVVASEILEVEDEEDNEPVDSAPVVEESSSSEAPSTNTERNPSTGAC